MKLRAPAVPLITIDPYFSVWSCSDTLNRTATCHWTGHTNTINGLLFIDDVPYRFMGGDDAGGIRMQQTSLTITALTTEYSFEAAGVHLDAHFLSPVLADDLMLCSRPVSYLELRAKSLDGMKHRLSVQINASEELCMDTARQMPVELEIVWPAPDVAAVRMGSKGQPILGSAEDDIRIDWGCFYLCVRAGRVGWCDHNGESFAVAEAEFVQGRALFAFAYDDIYSIEYFGKWLQAYWKRGGQTIQDAIAEAFFDYETLCGRARRFSRELWENGVRTGGEEYAELLSLAYRQVMAGHKLVEDEEGRLLYISKECLSNGCAATVDVSYPSVPMYLYYNPTLVEAMLRPILQYAKSGKWPYEYAPHDVGRYPKLNGQVYPNGFAQRMPVEECGNMLIMAAAASVASGNTELFEENRELFHQWAEYLLRHGADPEDQNCTDDFFKHLAHNCNLGVKAVIGVAALAVLLDCSGDSAEADRYMEKARDMARDWCKRAANNDGSYRLAFDQPDTYSLKYNIVWDKLFGTGLFTQKELETEFTSYWKYMNPYGIPLDCRGSTSKTDWLAWTAVLAPDKEQFARFMAPVWRYFNETENRVPMADWYSTKTAKRFYMQHRTVQGGLFIKLVEDAGICRCDKWT